MRIYKMDFVSKEWTKTAKEMGAIVTEEGFICAEDEEDLLKKMQSEFGKDAKKRVEYREVSAKEMVSLFEENLKNFVKEYYAKHRGQAGMMAQEAFPDLPKDEREYINAIVSFLTDQTNRKIVQRISDPRKMSVAELDGYVERLSDKNSGEDFGAVLDEIRTRFPKVD